MEPNISAALSGAIAGGIISFAVIAFFRYRDHEREKGILAAGIKAELESYKEETEKGIKGHEKYLQRLKESPGESDRMVINRGTDLIFIDASLQKLGVFGKGTVAQIVRLRSQHEVMKEMVSWINGNAPQGIDFFGSNREKILQGMIDGYARIVSYCDVIISDLNKS